MSRARVARRIATAAAYGGGGISLLGGAAAGLLLTEMQYARRRLSGGSGTEPPVADGVYGAAFAATPGPPWRLAILGDSTAAGQGVHRASQTPGALLASSLAAVSERTVELHSVALPGARSDDLERQVSMLLTEPGWAPVPDVCVIMIGANDVTGRVPPARSVKCLAEAVTRLRTAGCQVIVGTCPDLGSVEPVAQPLRWIARRLCRQLAAAQTIAVVELGGRTVSLGTLLGPEFAANPRELFGPDRYHPSAEGYATAALALLPTLCASLGVWPQERLPGAEPVDRLMPVAHAAVRAAEESGTEVAAAPRAGRLAPWARLRRHRRRAPAEERADTRPATGGETGGESRGDSGDGAKSPEAGAGDANGAGTDRASVT